LRDNGISIFDVATSEVHEILLREDHPYQDLGNDIAWSPDSRHLALLGNFAATSQLVIMKVNPAEAGIVRVRHSFDVGCRGNLSWTQRDGILVGVLDGESRETQLCSLNPDSEGEPVRARRFISQNGCRSACLTPDGQWYITVLEE
jgi:hypothetical protein